MCLSNYSCAHIQSPQLRETKIVTGEIQPAIQLFGTFWTPVY